MRIMLIEDDLETANFVVQGLNSAGHEVDHASSGIEGLAKLLNGKHEVAIVDRLLPELDGISIVKMLRAANSETRVIFVTTLARIDNRVEGLNAGADDYLTKPFAMVELVARVNALARRPKQGQTETILRLAELELNLIKRTTTRGGKAIHLQPMEFKLLETLMRQAGRLVTRTMLLEQVWNFRFDPQTTIVETHMSRLRAKVDRDFPVVLIETIHGGYCMRDPGAAKAPASKPPTMEPTSLPRPREAKNPKR
jgi:two-component system OmpR family response regulator